VSPALEREDYMKEIFCPECGGLAYFENDTQHKLFYLHIDQACSFRWNSELQTFEPAEVKSGS
jgi:hypothetical protein